MPNPGAALTRTAIGTNGMVASAHPFGTLAGLDVLRAGGTAMDAAVAAALVHSVVNPAMTGLGGDTVLLYYAARERRVVGLNGTGRSAAAATLEAYRGRGLTEIPVAGPLAVTVPGALDGWQRALARYGSRSLGDLLAPAIRYAEEGFPANPTFLAFFAQAGARAAAFAIDGRAPRLGERIVQRPLAATLATIAREGVDAFYRGSVGERVIAALREAGGLLSMEDLAGHTSEWVEPLAATFRGLTVFELPPNSLGVALLEQLNTLEALDLDTSAPDSLDRLHVQIEAARLALADVEAFVTDPAFAAVPLARLLSVEHARELGNRIARGRPAGTLRAAGMSENTAYIAVVDRAGNVASLMGSLRNPFGSGLVAGDTGILLHNRGKDFSLDPASVNRLEPGKRTRTTLNPVILLAKDRPRLVLGSVGGIQQTQAVQQVLVRHLVDGLAIQEAVEAPRWAVAEDGTLQLEAGLAPSAGGLTERGHRVVIGKGQFGACNAIRIDPETGALHGVADPRIVGAALGY